MGVIHQ